MACHRYPTYRGLLSISTLSILVGKVLGLACSTRFLIIPMGTVKLGCPSTLFSVLAGSFCTFGYSSESTDLWSFLIPSLSYRSHVPSQSLCHAGSPLSWVRLPHLCLLLEVGACLNYHCNPGGLHGRSAQYTLRK